eukprot:CAMPEP_0201487008 /NCGR_PEP_ID=MMETSP0151_2-20130828/11023_1 /ASSEMBLY_ACC=CAM_ASM_000257 /TAXON_ID=200890 /ORGANISM="Paramoeba atlantica, Strain 621/1 / CCAP 1560/9" /LENGTH=148 /DNA_ID=CAMNT_0047871923 /DNA_START=111 /DNA_END=558 /DNA_ORIENTATION=-
MYDPVILSDGETYERSAITEWISRNPKSPMTNQRVDKRLIPNQNLCRQIRSHFPTLKDGTMNIDWFDCLPDEIIFEIFSNLDVVSLVSCSEVFGGGMESQEIQNSGLIFYVFIFHKMRKRNKSGKKEKEELAFQMNLGTFIEIFIKQK